MKRFIYLENGEFELAYGVMDTIKEKRAAFEKEYLFKTVVGILLCIFGVIPLLIAGISGSSDMFYTAFSALIFVSTAAGVSLIVSAAIVKSGYDQLLFENEYQLALKEKNKKRNAFSGAYWLIVTAAFLGWSIISNDWWLTWIVRPVAALAYAGIMVALSGSQGK